MFDSFPTTPQCIKEKLCEARAILADSNTKESIRVAASRYIRRLTQCIYLNITIEDWDPKELRKMLDEADLGINAMQEHKGIVVKEVEKYHVIGTTADAIIQDCKSRIFTVRQQAEIFS